MSGLFKNHEHHLIKAHRARYSTSYGEYIFLSPRKNPRLETITIFFLTTYEYPSCSLSASPHRLETISASPQVARNFNCFLILDSSSTTDLPYTQPSHTTTWLQKNAFVGYHNPTRVLQQAPNQMVLNVPPASAALTTTFSTQTGRSSSPDLLPRSNLSKRSPQNLQSHHNHRLLRSIVFRRSCNNVRKI